MSEEQKLCSGNSGKAVEPDEIQVRKVRVLNDRAREEARKQNLDDEDLVLLKTTYGSLPTYEIQKIEGSAIEFLQKELIKPA